MINGMFDSGAMPALEKMAQFTGERNKLIAHNIANFSNPYHKRVDMDPRAFQAQLRDAIDQRRATPHPTRGKLHLGGTGPAKSSADGKLAFTAKSSATNLLFHDQNNRDVERTMQDLVENTLVHRTSIDLLKNQFDMLEMAIRERV